jgi:hypothetical protein
MKDLWALFHTILAHLTNVFRYDMNMPIAHEYTTIPYLFRTIENNVNV